MTKTDKYGKLRFDEEDEDSLLTAAPIEEGPGINWAERIKHLQEDYEAEMQYLEDLEDDADEIPGWRNAMRRLGRL